MCIILLVVCRNKDSNCDKFAAAGYCTNTNNNIWMLKNCPASCCDEAGSKSNNWNVTSVQRYITLHLLCARHEMVYVNQ